MPELRIQLTILALVAAMVLAGAIGLKQRVGAVMLALLSFVWLTVDVEFEGGLIVKLTKTHGLVVADLVGLLGLVCAFALWWRLRRR